MPQQLDRLSAFDSNKVGLEISGRRCFETKRVQPEPLISFALALFLTALAGIICGILIQHLNL